MTLLRETLLGENGRFGWCFPSFWGSDGGPRGHGWGTWPPGTWMRPEDAMNGLSGKSWAATTWLRPRNHNAIKDFDQPLGFSYFRVEVYQFFFLWKTWYCKIVYFKMWYNALQLKKFHYTIFRVINRKSYEFSIFGWFDCYPSVLHLISKWFSLKMEGFHTYVTFIKCKTYHHFFGLKDTKFWPHGNRSNA